MSHRLPDKAANGYVTLSDFYPKYREPIEQALKTAGIQNQIEDYLVPENSWMYGVFRVYVPKSAVETGKDICSAINYGSVF